MDKIPIQVWKMFPILIISLVAPLPLILIEKIIPYPSLTEEIIKTGLVFLAVNFLPQKLHLKTVLLAGLFFSISENLLYLSNFIVDGFLSLYLLRFLTGTLLHITTSLVIYFFWKECKKGVLPGILPASFIHFLYNRIIPLLLR